MTYLASFLLTCAIQVTGFVFAYFLQTETFYDIFGGLNYLALAAHSYLSSSNNHDAHKVLMTVLFVVSRSWLLLFLAWRAHERKGDARFDKIKDKAVLFLLVWLVQGLWCFLISMPLLFVNASTNAVTEPLTVLDKASLVGFGLGIAVEIAADVQKALWVKRGRTGGFCSVGVWKYSRHPNYFGEMLQWWCAFACAYSCSEGPSDPLWWSCSISPLFTMHILLNMSGTGISNAEGKNLKRYYDQCPTEYAEYRDKTCVLLPMVGYRHVPLVLKRTLFLDFARYEYKPSSAKEKKP